MPEEALGRVALWESIAPTKAKPTVSVFLHGKSGKLEYKDGSSSIEASNAVDFGSTLSRYVGSKPKQCI